MAYYYLISSLPMLTADADMPISYDTFLKMCHDNVSKTKYEILKDLSVESKDGMLISEWAKFYTAFKNELTFRRNERLGRKNKEKDKADESVSKVILDALSDDNPLNAEKTLLELQFQKLDELIGTHYFDDFALFGYALKLKLLERKKVFNNETGKKEFNRIIDSLEEQIRKVE